MRNFGIAAAAGTAALCVLASQAFAASLPSYEAQYELRLTHASSGKGPRAATGVFSSRVAETCDGWDTKSHVIMDLAFRDGHNTTNERFFTSWEAKNGLDYRFSVRTTKNGATVESFQGTAKLGRNGGAAVYETPSPEGQNKPSKITVALPRGTLLPMAHSRALLTHAGGGEALFRSVVLNGSSSTGPRIMSVVIGPKPAGDDGVSKDIDPTLLGTPSWRMSSAYFNLNETRDTPNFELMLDLHASGVTEYFEQTFADFSVSATLKKLRRIDAPVCP